MKKIALLLLLPSLAFGQGLSLTAPGVTGGGKVLWQAPFSVPGCYASGQTAGASSAIAITRTTKGTVALTSDASALTECASGEFRVGYQGLLVEPARTNYALQSNTMSTGTAATSPWTTAAATVATVAGAPMGGTWAEVTADNANETLYQEATAAASSTFVVSTWMAKASGTGGAKILALSSTSATVAISACTCVRSDGGSCTATISPAAIGTQYCEADVADLGTTPVRLSMAYTTASAVNNPRIYLGPERRGVAPGVTRFSGAQFEVGTYPTSLIVSTSTSVARNQDAVSATVPSLPAKFSVAGTFKKNTGAPWTSGTPWSLGTAAGANSASLTMGAANLVFTLIDGSTASKTCTVTAPGYAAGSSNALTAKGLAGTLSLTGGCTQAGAGTGQFGTAPTTLYLGATSAGDQFGGFVKGLTLNKVTK